MFMVTFTPPRTRSGERVMCLPNSPFVYVQNSLFLLFLIYLSPSHSSSPVSHCLHLSLSPSSSSLLLPPPLPHILCLPLAPTPLLSLQSPEVCLGVRELRVVCTGLFSARERLSALFSPLGWLNYSQCVKQCN